MTQLLGQCPWCSSRQGAPSRSRWQLALCPQGSCGLNALWLMFLGVLGPGRPARFSLKWVCVLQPCCPNHYQCEEGVQAMMLTRPLSRESSSLPALNSRCFNSLLCFHLLSKCTLKCGSFSVPQGGESVSTLPSVGRCAGGGVPSITESPALLPFFMQSFYPSLCRRCSLRPQFFLRVKCSVCGGRFSV